MCVSHGKKTDGPRLEEGFTRTIAEQNSQFPAIGGVVKKRVSQRRGKGPPRDPPVSSVRSTLSPSSAAVSLAVSSRSGAKRFQKSFARFSAARRGSDKGKTPAEFNEKSRRPRPFPSNRNSRMCTSPPRCSFFSALLPSSTSRWVKFENKKKKEFRFVSRILFQFSPFL